MNESQDTIPAFIEAHYYPDGKKSFHVSLTDGRPAWAPPSKDVGFSQEDNIALNQHDLVVEFERRLFLEKRLTWCAVYSRSIDETVGDRRQNAGVGIWLSEYHITDFRYIIECLRKLLTLVANKFDQGRFEAASADFLRNVLPAYVDLAVEYPDGFQGIPFAQTTSSKKFVTDYKAADLEEMIVDAADHLSYLSFGYDVETFSRAVIHIPAGSELPTLNGKFKVIAKNENKLSKFISSIPKASGNVASKVASLEADLKDAQNQYVDLQAGLAEKNEKVNQLETKVAALQAEIDASVQDGDSIRILKQISLLEQKLNLHEQNIVAEVQKLSVSLPRLQPKKQFSPLENRGQASPFVAKIQTSGTANKHLAQPYGNRPKSPMPFWLLLVLTAFVIACSIGIFVLLMYFEEFSFFNN
jgi:hypothetical protein